MITLIKKYIILIIISLILVNLITATILTIWPHLLTFTISENSSRTIDTAYLKIGIGFIFNIIFVFLLLSDMRKENIRANLVLILTFFSNVIGVPFFFLILAHKKLNYKNINYE